MKKIHYICHYNDVLGERELDIQLSGVTKINYIKSALKKAGFYVSVFSVAEATCQKNVHYSYIAKKIDTNEEIIYINSFGRTNILLKLISRIWKQIQLLFYMSFRIKSTETVLIYHSLVLRWPVRVMRLFTKKRIYIEVEEIYNAALNRNNSYINKEKKYLRNNADGYILVNDIIKGKCDFTKPSVVCYGDYRSVSITKSNFDDDKIHIVYAGGIDDEGTDAFIAAELIKFLPEAYRIHILGYGVEINILKLKELICNLNKSLGYEAVFYDGCLVGETYLRYLSKFNIGLCTRVLADNLSDYTFPSKVMVYLGNNIIPVCSPISCIVNSKVKELVMFCKQISPQPVAETILTIPVDKRIDYSETLKKLDIDFINDLKILFS